MGRRSLGKYDLNKPKGTKYKGYILVKRDDGKIDIFRKIYHIDRFDNKQDAKDTIDKFYKRREKENNLKQ